MIDIVDSKIEEYAIAKSEPTSELLRELVEVTYKSTPVPQMITGPMEGRFLKIVAATLGARRALEIGMFTGYSALSVAEALPDDGELVTCEISQAHIQIARRFFERSPHGKKIKIMEGKALESLAKLQAPFDLCFIDADKENYSNYYERVLPLMRQGGVILVDNVLWSGRVLHPKTEEDKAIAQLNDLVKGDDRVDRVLLPIRDGVFFIRKR